MRRQDMQGLVEIYGPRVVAAVILLQTARRLAPDLVALVLTADGEKVWRATENEGGL